MGIPKKLLAWLSSYLGNRKIKTNLNNKISCTADLICGVPQGSVLGPTLFLCYINDLSMVTKELGLSISLYADDAIIYCSNHEHYFVKDRLERALAHIIEWCRENYININIDKTKFCIYGSRAKISKFKEHSLTSDANQIHQCKQYQYPGVILDECLTMKQNLNSSFKKNSYKIHQFGKIKKFLNFETRILVYKQTVLPLTQYVSFVLSLNTKNDVEKLQKLQNRALRMCYNIQNPRDISIAQLHEMANVEMLQKRRMMQLLCIIYDIVYKSQKMTVRNTRLANKHNIDINRANTQLYSKSPYVIGGQIWNNLPRVKRQTQTGAFQHYMKY